MKAKASNRLVAATVVCGAFLMAWRDESAIGQTSSVKAEYLLTIYLDIKQSFTNDGLRVVDMVRVSRGRSCHHPAIGSGPWLPGSAELVCGSLFRLTTVKSYMSHIMASNSVPRKAMKG
jgi:hypothetical protein